MKPHRLFAPALTLFACAAAFGQRAGPPDVQYTPPGFQTLQIGDRAPDFLLPGADGKRHALAEYSDAPYLMVIFLCNHCPVSHAAETRLVPFVREMRDRGLAVVAINPNNDAGTQIDELGYSNYGEDLAGTTAYARDHHLEFPYLYDGDTQAAAKAYGCLATPHVFLFDRERHLRYKGRFDDSDLPDPGSVHHSEAIAAVRALVSGQPIAEPETKPIGCSTKWEGLKAVVDKFNASWLRMPVTVQKITAPEVAALVKNPTNKLRVINVWATWCVPCVEEFPSMVTLSRRMERRNFEIITISIDDPRRAKQVSSFLQKQHAAVPPLDLASVRGEGRQTNNYLYAGGGTDALVQALDPHWPGPLPYTIVVAPGGEIVYRCSGAVDVEALQSQIVDRLGVYHARKAI